MSSYNHWQKDLSDSIRALSNPENLQTIRRHIISGKIYSIESSDDSVLMLMDRKAGIDYIREDEKGLQGIAARVQWDDGRPGYPYNTFTMRERRHTGTKTEVEKRIEAIENGYFYPAFTLQMYCDTRENNAIVSIAAIHTKVLYRLFTESPELFEGACSDNGFRFVRWSRISEHVRAVEREVLK